MIYRTALFSAVILGAANAYAAAPDGIGALKLGMLPQQVERLQQGNVVVSNFRKDEKQETAGEVKYKSTLKSPISYQPAETDLTFINGKLASIFMRFSDAASGSSVSFTQDQQEAIKMLTAKYGAPKVEKTWEDKQCIYGSGNSFTKKNGNERYRWSAVLPGGMERYATVSTWIFDMCPVSLRYNFSTKAESRLLQIGIQKVVVKANPF
jgi:hypothetical protein